jgi:uncharacterized membrane protein YbaN (DUF454 family)
MKKITYLLLGHLSLALGIIGAFLPVLPTTPFLLLAAFFYSKSSARLHMWMLEHKYLGPPLKDWQQSGVIGIKAKWLATVMILLVIGWRFPKLNIDLWIKILASSVLLAVLAFIWTRPSKSKQ